MSALYARAAILLRPRWRLVVAAVAFAFLSAATDAGFAIVAGTLAQWLFGVSGLPHPELAWLFGQSHGMGLVLGLAIVTSARAIGTLGAAWVTARLGTEIAHELRTALYARTAANALPRTLAHHRGDLVSRLQDDVEIIQNTLTYSVTGIAHTILSTLMVGSVIFSIDPLVGLSCLVGAPLCGVDRSGRQPKVLLAVRGAAPGPRNDDGTHRRDRRRRGRGAEFGSGGADVGAIREPLGPRESHFAFACWYLCDYQTSPFDRGSGRLRSVTDLLELHDRSGSGRAGGPACRGRHPDPTAARCFRLVRAGGCYP